MGHGYERRSDYCGTGAARGRAGTLRDDLANTRTAIMDRIDRARHNIDLLRDGVVVNYGAADRTVL
jgi:hypothetical protein